MHVLTIEDDPMVSRLIESILKQSNINVSLAATGEEGIDFATVYDYDLILLDLNLPDLTGHEVLRKLRETRVETPILILTGAADTESKLKGFGWGADDYVMKPFRKEELIARIHAIVRRSRGHSQSVTRIGKLTVNLDAKTIEVDGVPVKLTNKEFQLFELLLLRKGTALSRELILNHLYGGIDEPEIKIIDVFISKLRKTLARATGEGSYIETIWGLGYMLREPEPVEAA